FVSWTRLAHWIFISQAQSAVVGVQAHELDPLIGLRISRRWAGDQHYPFGRNSVLAHPACSPFAPVIRFFQQIDWMYPVGEGEILRYSRIRARRDDPDRRFEARNGARHRAATGRHE